MSDAKTRQDDEKRIEELMRVNAELAAEIRSLTLGRAAKPRSATIPSARRVTRLVAERDALAAERDALAAERDALAAELKAAKAEIERIEEHNQQLGRETHALAEEVARLRAGVRGAVRVGFARLFRR